VAARLVVKISRWKRTGRFSFRALLAVSLGLPLVLAFHAVLTSRELNEMRSIYLRDRAANIAARLEAMPADRLTRGDFEELLESEPALLAIRAFSPADKEAATPALEAIRSGRELYHTEAIGTGQSAAFRAYIPFHSSGEVYVARLDLSAAAPDFILVHARHNTLIAFLSGAVLLVLSFFAMWSMRRASRLERLQLETERLAQLGTLSAVLAHEIRNPLGAIKGFAQLAREGADSGQAKPLDAIVRESRRLENLVDSLLLYGRPVTPTVGLTDWQPLADDLEAYARDLIGARPIRFTIESEIRRLSTDPNMLKQTLLNLVRNSVEAIPAGTSGNVKLGVMAGRGGAVSISVEDDGPGIPEDVSSRLFSPFTTGKSSGTGLGLSISKKLVEAMGGTLQLLPIEPHGTRAALELYGTNPDC
jgi:signal transduction histidine kinase